jgi:hypothetical protein
MGKFFSSIQAGDLPEWLSLETNKAELLDAGDDPLQLLSPVATKAKHGCFDIIPTFSFNSVSSEDGLKKGSAQLSLEEHLE